MIDTSDKLLTEKEAAARLGTSPASLAVWRCTRRQPLPFVRIGRAIRYRISDIDRFIADRVVSPVAPDSAQ